MRADLLRIGLIAALTLAGPALAPAQDKSQQNAADEAQIKSAPAPAAQPPGSGAAQDRGSQETADKMLNKLPAATGGNAGSPPAVTATPGSAPSGRDRAPEPPRVSPLAVQDGPVLQDGKLAAPGAVGGSATEPAKFSAANDATDKAGAQAISASAWRTDLGK